MFRFFSLLVKIWMEIKWKYLFSLTAIRVSKGAVCVIEDNVSINQCRIYLSAKATLIIHKCAKLKGVNITIEDGEFEIGEYSILNKGTNENFPLFLINKGRIVMGHHSKISCKRIWIRFGGIFQIGDYTNINSGSEVRVDEKISIGSYNQISYNVNIWDTNTHNIYPVEIRRKIAEKYYPYFGYEKEKPKTSPVVIGNDCWVGQNSSILKGTCIGNNVIVGYHTLLANKTIEDGKKVISNNNCKIID